MLKSCQYLGQPFRYRQPEKYCIQPTAEKEMATHYSILAWRIPGTEEPGGLPSMGSHRVGHDWSDLAAAAAELIIVLLPRSKRFWISWLQSPSAVILEPKKIKPHCFHCFPIDLHEVMGLDTMILVFWMLNFKPAFSVFFFTFIERPFSWGWCHLHIWGYWYFSQQSWFQLVLHPAWHFTWCTLHLS